MSNGFFRIRQCRLFAPQMHALTWPLVLLQCVMFDLTFFVLRSTKDRPTRTVKANMGIEMPSWYV